VFLKRKGYNVKPPYGGDAFFDNMEDFFQEMDMISLTKKHSNPTKLLDNIWGVVMKTCTTRLKV
jgi:hypothetical protein